jgi:hypothetical protein
MQIIETSVKTAFVKSSVFYFSISHKIRRYKEDFKELHYKIS